MRTLLHPGTGTDPIGFFLAEPARGEALAAGTGTDPVSAAFGEGSHRASMRPR
jgi:hypothetical protein